MLRLLIIAALGLAAIYAFSVAGKQRNFSTPQATAPEALGSKGPAPGRPERRRPDAQVIPQSAFVPGRELEADARRLFASRVDGRPGPDAGTGSSAENALLVARLAEVERANGRAVAAFQARLDELSQALTASRAQVEQAALDNVVALEGRRTAENASRENGESLERAGRQVDDLVRELEAARRDAASSAVAVQQEVERQREVSTQLEAAVADSVRVAVGKAEAAMLPDDKPAHIVLQYLRDVEPARLHALAIVGRLRAAGLDVPEPVATPGPAKAGVIFFYDEDFGTAQRIASILLTSAPVQSRFPAASTVPRPGTIKIAVSS